MGGAWKLRGNEPPHVGSYFFWFMNGPSAPPPVFHPDLDCLLDR